MSIFCVCLPSLCAEPDYTLADHESHEIDCAGLNPEALLVAPISQNEHKHKSTKNDSKLARKSRTLDSVEDTAIAELNPRESSNSHKELKKNKSNKVDKENMPEPTTLLKSMGSVEPRITTGEDAANVRNALFAELNQGDGVKAHLTHLTAEEKQKRRAAAKKAGGKVAAPKQQIIVTPKAGPPPFFECVADREWIVENQVEGVKEINADEIKFKHAVTVRNCSNFTLVIHGKCSNLMMDTCTKANVVFNGVMAGSEMIRCKDSNVQIMSGTCATFTLDHTHSANIYLGTESKSNSKFTTTCCSGLNIWFPSKDDAEEMICKPIPEQFTAHISEADEVDVKVSDLYLAQ